MWNAQFVTGGIIFRNNSMVFINRYSLLIGIVVLTVLLTSILCKNQAAARNYLVLGGLLLLIALGWWIFRPTASPLQEIDEVRTQIGGGTPVLLEFQSPY